MTTITAKELRDNLEEIAKRVQAGESMLVSYRSKPSFRLEPIIDEAQTDPMSGIDAFFATPSKPLDQKIMTDDLKELYHEHLEEKYGHNS